MEKLDSERKCDHHKAYSATIPRAWICRFCGQEGEDRMTVFTKEPNEYDTLKHKKAAGGFDAAK